MRTRFALLAALVLLASGPAMAGTLTFDNGQTTWHSTQCPKPNPPPSIINAHPETAGDDMNNLVGQYNAYVNDAQNYMNCISNEAEHDQAGVSQAISGSAQRSISDMQQEVDTLGRPFRNAHAN